MTSEYIQDLANAPMPTDIDDLRAACHGLRSAVHQLLDEFTDERRKVLEEAIAVAIGCKDYGGGYHGSPEYEAFHFGMEVVARSLQKRLNGPDCQSNVVLAIGREELAKQKEAK